MKKLLVLILSAVMLATALTACGESANGQPSGGTGTSDVTVSNTDAAVPPNTNAIPSELDGAYADDTHYMVIRDGVMSIDNVACEITYIETDVFYEDDTPVYFFDYNGEEATFYYEDDCLMCSVGLEDDWNCWDEIDIADVPTSFSTEAESGENLFEGTVYYLDGFEDSRKLEITGMDADGNITEVVIDYTTMEMINSSSKPYGENETAYSMEYVDGSFGLSLIYDSSRGMFSVAFSGEMPSSEDIIDGDYYSAETAYLAGESSDDQDDLYDFIGSVYTYTDDAGVSHTFTVLDSSMLLDGVLPVISQVSLDNHEFSLTDCTLVWGESMEYSTSVATFKGYVDGGNVYVEISYYVDPDFFTLHFSCAPQDAPDFKVIDGKFE